MGFILLWLSFVWAVRKGHVAAGWADLALMFAPLVVVPLGLRVLAGSRSPALSQATAWVGLAVPLSYLLRSGTTAAFMAAPWLLFTLVAAVLHCRPPFLAGGWRGALEKASFVYLGVAGVWTVVARTGRAFMGFDPVICLLTANHFHYAGFAALVIASRARRLQPFTAACILFCPVLIAIGITALPMLEWIAALLFAGALLVVAASNIRQSGPLLGLAYLCLFFTMPLAGCYALAEFFPGVPALTIAEMIPMHGLVNAFGFSFLGLLALDSQAAHLGAGEGQTESSAPD